MKPALELAVRLCDDITARQLAAGRVLPWSWGPALFGYALSQLDGYVGLYERPAGQHASPAGGSYEPWLRAYCDHYVTHPPKIDQSDRAAPGLITEAMARRTGNPAYAALTERVVDYIRTEPRLIGDAVNHLGPSLIGRCYPRSVWVDSLMMFGVFPARYGRDHDDPELLRIAARQPAAYARLMQDQRTGLWAHSYWARRARRYPEREIFWARGNGWVVAALPMIMDAIADRHPVELAESTAILARTSAALLGVQRPDGTWGTLLDGRSYRELSATALIASGWLHAVRRGYLPSEYAEPARRAIDAVSSRLRITADRDGLRWCLPEISGPTIPWPIAPRLGYLLTPRGGNHSYGVAAYVFAAINDHLLER